MSKLIIPALLIVALLGCSRETAPAEELPQSIRQLIAGNNNCTCEPYINLYNWKGQKIYLLAAKGPACNWTPFFYNEKGEQITMNSNYTLDQFWGESLLIKQVWTCEEPVTPGG